MLRKVGPRKQRGKKGAPEFIPAGAVEVLRNAIPLAGLTRGEGKMFTFQDKAYILDDVFDAMEAEGLGSGGGGAGGTGGTGSGSSQDDGDGGGGMERKRINDIMRMAGIFVEDDVRHLAMEYKL